MFACHSTAKRLSTSGLITHQIAVSFRHCILGGLLLWRDFLMSYRGAYFKPRLKCFVSCADCRPRRTRIFATEQRNLHRWAHPDWGGNLEIPTMVNKGCAATPIWTFVATQGKKESSLLPELEDVWVDIWNMRRACELSWGIYFLVSQREPVLEHVSGELMQWDQLTDLLWDQLTCQRCGQLTGPANISFVGRYLFFCLFDTKHVNPPVLISLFHALVAEGRTHILACLWLLQATIFTENFNDDRQYSNFNSVWYFQIDFDYLQSIQNNSILIVCTLQKRNWFFEPNSRNYLLGFAVMDVH